MWTSKRVFREQSTCHNVTIHQRAGIKRPGNEVKMRALMLASVASMLDQFNRNNIQLLKKLGYQVDIACNFEEGNTSSQEQVRAFRSQMEKEGVKPIQIPIPRKISAVGNILKSYRMVKRLMEENQYDIVHCHSPIGGVIARLACRKQRKKGLRVIYTAHGFHFFSGAPRKNWIIFYTIEKMLARYTDILITICKEDYERAKRKKLGRKIVYSPGIGIDTASIRNLIPVEDKRAEIGISPEDKIVLSIGELNANKNHEVILRAIGSLRRTDIHYVICGRGNLEQHLEKAARETGMENRLHLLGFRTDAKEWLKAADIFAFPSYREGLPVSLMEGMAAGLPVVCSKVRGNVDLIEHKKGGYMTTPENTAYFAKAIEHLLLKPELRTQMGAYNQNSIQAFDKKKVEKVMYQVYGENVKPIRVLHMLHSMNCGGAETMIMNYYRNIDREQVQFDFLLTCQGKSDYEEEILSLGGRIYHITPLTLRTMGAYQRDIRNFLQEHTEYRIVHSHNSSKSVFPLRIAKKMGIPVRISHSHNLFVGNAYSPKEILRKFLKRPLRKVSNFNFACSKDAAIWLYGEKFWKEKKVQILKNAIDVARFSYRKEIRQEYRKKFDLEDKFVVGHVGRFDQIKNHMFLLEIFSEILKKQENATLVLVGEGELCPKIKEEAGKKGILDKIIFTGLREDVPGLLQMMDVFVFPSLFEGLGIVLIEAQTSGLPCFASKDVIPKEAAVTDLLEFVSLDEPAPNWADKILQAQTGQNRQSPISKVQKAGYDISVEAKKLEKFYLQHSVL